MTGPASAPRAAVPGATTSPALLAPADFAALHEQPVTEHVAVYAALHERLQDALTAIDEA